MFGQSTTPFGSPQGGFGQTNSAPTFGSPAPAPFGAPAPGFGNRSAFGTPAPAPSGFGGFGAPAPTTGFGGGGGGFGAPAPAPSAFGSSVGGFGSSTTNSSPFGAPAPAPSGGLFGSAPAPSGGLFGSAPSTAGGFGSTTSTNTGFGGFGSNSTPSSGFGGGSAFGAPAPAPSTGLFGAPSSGGFGSSAFGSSTTSTFGSPAPAPSGGLFGAPAPASGGLFGAPPAAAPGQGGGTKMTPYQVTSRQDGATTINLQAITAMPAYESKSFEELRFEDYSQGNRGTGTQSAAGGFGGFGAPAPAPSGGLFGSTPAPAFGAPAPASGGFGSFGAPAPSAFGGSLGAPAPSAFGAPAAFGTPAPASSFGSFGAKPPASGGLFGAPAPATGGLFGSPPATTTGGLFGSTPAPAPAFGAPAPASGGLFGAPAPASGGLFGSTPAPSSAFGAPAPAPGSFGFGAPAPASGSLFGTPAPAPAFGAPASGSLFGAPAPSPGGGLFGAKPPTSGFFGAPAPAPAFGSPAPAPSLFGAPAPAPLLPAAPPAGSIMPPAANEILAQQLTAIETQRKELEKMDVWQSKPSESSAVIASSLPESDSWASTTPIRASISPYKASPKSIARIRPRGFASPDKTSTPSLSKLGQGSRPMMTPESVAASSVTRLVIKPSPKPKLRLTMDSSGAAGETKAQEQSSPFMTGTASPAKETKQSTSPGMSIMARSAQQSRTSPVIPTEQERDGSTGKAAPTPTSAAQGGQGYDYYQKIIASPQADQAAGSRHVKVNVIPKLSKAGYHCTPPLEVLQTMESEDLAAVSGFSIERKGFGKIQWEGAVDVRGADLDQNAVIEQSTASMYMKDEEEDKKPPVGSKLNRPAIITLYNVFPKEGAGADGETKMKFAKRVERSTSRMGAELISYDCTNGVWKMRAQHFSKYGLLDDDSEGEEETTVAASLSSPQKHFESGERGGRSRAVIKGILKQPNTTTAYNDQALVSSEEESANASDMEVTDESKVFEDAEAAYANMTEMLDTKMSSPERDDDQEDFPDEGESPDILFSTNRFVPSTQDVINAGQGRSRSSELMVRMGIKSSEIDFGIRFGRSFRGCWGPDGCFVNLPYNGSLVRRRPVFTKDSQLNVEMLETHRANATIEESKERCPRISLPQMNQSATALQNTIRSYASGDDNIRSLSGGRKDSSISKQAFSLLSWIMDGLDADQSSAEERQMFALAQWLVDCCSEEVDKEIQDAIASRDKYSAILAAVTGGDIEKACKTASELGMMQLAAMLSSGSQGRKDILKEAHSWTDKVPTKIPDQLIRIYFLIGGDPKMEEDIYRRRYSPFDWRRRLSMRLTYNFSGAGAKIEDLIRDYEASLSAGVTPYPQPHYMSSTSREKLQCVLYRLLRMSQPKSKMQLSEVVDPVGHTSAVHDFSVSFHLASAISAMSCCVPLSPVEEQRIISGYMDQLVNANKWEWAVYISLCSLSMAETEPAVWTTKRAKSLILQKFRGDADKDRRQFLEQVGIPKAWFEEAEALRCATAGDVFGYLKHMSSFSPEAACPTLERVLIPNILFMNSGQLKQSRELLEVFSASRNSLASALHHLLQLYENLAQLEGAGEDEFQQAKPSLLEACDHVEKIFLAYKSGESKLKGQGLHLIPETKVVPMPCFLAEALSHVSLFRLKMKALECGVPSCNMASRLLSVSTVEDFEEKGMSSRDNILRWLM